MYKSILQYPFVLLLLLANSMFAIVTSNKQFTLNQKSKHFDFKDINGELDIVTNLDDCINVFEFYPDCIVQLFESNSDLNSLYIDLRSSTYIEIGKDYGLRKPDFKHNNLNVYIELN